MKYLLCLTLFSPFYILAQSLKPDILSADTSIIKKQVLFIMNELSIEKREYINRDNPIKIIIDESSIYFNCEFRVDSVIEHYKYLSRRVYINARIYTSRSFDSVFHHKKDTSKSVYIKSLSFFIHELAHYYQVTRDDVSLDPTNKKQELQYISQPAEFEAWGVGAYYFLNFYNKKELTKIMSKKTNNKNKIKMLINAYRKILYPWREKVFKEVAYLR